MAGGKTYGLRVAEVSGVSLTGRGVLSSWWLCLVLDCWVWCVLGSQCECC